MLYVYCGKTVFRQTPPLLRVLFRRYTITRETMLLLSSGDYLQEPYFLPYPAQ